MRCSKKARSQRPYAPSLPMSPISGVDCIVAIPGKGAAIVPIQDPIADILKQWRQPQACCLSLSVHEGG
jgi:hypothetical protein